jgi:transcriptional regulator GlxA family with amidase domain
MYDFTLIAVPGSYGTSVAVTLDILRAAEFLAPRAAVPAPRWRVCSVDGGHVRLQSGLILDTERLSSASRTDRSIWILPGFGMTRTREIEAFLARDDVERLTKALIRHVDRGGLIAAGCSAVFLLNRAELLDHRKVTTTWWLAPLLQGQNASCRVDATRMVCEDGPIITAGAAFAQTDLMLHLLRKVCGAQLVELICRLLILDARDVQSPYVVPEILAGGDALVAQIVARVEQALPTTPTVSELARQFCISERTLARHIRRATGSSTLALIQSVRLRKARHLLEQSRMSVEQVAEAVGYTDSTALRRLMLKATGANPSRYRPGLSSPTVAEPARN